MAEPYDVLLSGGLGIIEWVQANMARGAEFVDIGYDSDNLGAPTIYDDEVDAMGAYPRRKELWPGSMGSAPAGHRP
jgi:hypothetical protein